jgi:hypothetical protein
MATNDDKTRVEELPPEETGPVPVTVTRVEPRWYGVTPTGSVVAVGAAAVAVGLILLLVGSTAPGVVLLIGGALTLAAVWRGPIAEALRGPVTIARTSVAVRRSAGRRLAVLRRELAELGLERERKLRALGAAVYAGEDAARESLQAELVELEAHSEEKQAEVERIVNEAQS